MDAPAKAPAPLQATAGPQGAAIGRRGADDASSSATDAIAPDPGRRRPPGLHARLLPLLAALLLAVVAMVAGEVMIGRVEERARDDAMLRAEVGAGVVEQVVLRRLEAVEVLHRLSQSWFLLRAAGNTGGRDAIEQQLTTTMESGSFGFIQVAHIDRDGWMIWSTVSGYSRVFLGDREHFQVHERGREQLFVSQPVLGRVSNRWTIQLTRPLRDAAGAFAGVVVVSMDLYSLSDALAELHLNESDRALLLRDMTIVARSRDAPGYINLELNEGDPLRRGFARAAHGAVERTDRDGLANIAGWRVLPNTPLRAVYILDLAELLSDLATTRAAVRAGAAGAAVFMLVVAGLFILAAERRRSRLALDQADAERRLAEAARHAFERRIAGLPAVVYGGDLSAEGAFSLTHVSASLHRVTGWPPVAFARGMDWRDMMDHVSAGARDGFMREVLRDGSGMREYRLRRPDGDWLWVRDQVRVVQARPDGTAEIVGYVADITQERDIQAKAEANGRLATLGEMATGLAHELNQPLAVMSLAAENAARALNRRGADGIPDVLTRLDRISLQAQRARDVVDHLRVFGRPDEGAPEPTLLATAVDGALVLTGGALRGREIAVDVALAQDLPPVMARLVPLEQAIVNLIVNARDAIEASGRKDGLIRIRAVRHGDGVRFTIADNGGGIPESAMYRLFEPFFTTKAPDKGTGLGLPICHATMRAFGGSIAAANDEAGAVFTLDFRAAVPVPA